MTASGRDWNAACVLHSHLSTIASQSTKCTIPSRHSQAPVTQWSVYTRVPVKCCCIIQNMSLWWIMWNTSETHSACIVIYLYHTSAFIYYLYILNNIIIQCTYNTASWWITNNSLEQCRVVLFFIAKTIHEDPDFWFVDVWFQKWHISSLTYLPTVFEALQLGGQRMWGPAVSECKHTHT